MCLRVSRVKVSGGRPARWSAPHAKVGQGHFGIAGLGCFGLGACRGGIGRAGSVWLADRTLPKPVSEGHNWSLSPCSDLCQPRLRRSARIHHRRRLGAVLLRGDQRLQRGVHSDNDVPADRRHVVPEQTQMRYCSANTRRRSRAPNGKKQYALVGEPETARDGSTRCTGCSARNTPASHRTR